MKKCLLVVCSFFALLRMYGQQNMAFSHISTEDGLGLNSDMVFTLCADKKGFIWVGTANGLQRFDGSKFINVSSNNANKLPNNHLNQIIATKSGDSLWLHFESSNLIGIFHIPTQAFTPITINAKNNLPLRTTKRLWQSADGNIYFDVWRYGIFWFNKKNGLLEDTNPFKLPKGWQPTVYHFEDTIKHRIWLPCGDSGLAYYDTQQKLLVTNRSAIGAKNGLLQNKLLQKGVSEVFIDHQKRYWVFTWDTAHHRYCFTENGIVYPISNNIYKASGYQELRYFFQTSAKAVWFYGLNALYYLNNNDTSIQYVDGNKHSETIIKYGSINQITEDKEGGIWLATDEGIYYTSAASNRNLIANIDFVNVQRQPIEFTDILEQQPNKFWLATWGNGVVGFTNQLQTFTIPIYKNMPAVDAVAKSQYKQTWTLYQTKDSIVWIGCQAGKYILFNTKTQKTSFHQLPEAEFATIRYITATRNNKILLGTQRGHLIKYDGNNFSVLHKFGTIVRKILTDNQGDIWVALEGGGVIWLDAEANNIKKIFTTNNGNHQLFQTNAFDLEVLNDSTIIAAAGALNFINKKRSAVKWLTVEDGLPSNSVIRIRKDKLGYIWIITNNGLCRYNPTNNRITPYGRKDGFLLARKAIEADILTHKGEVLFAGSGALLWFKPAAFTIKNNPPNIVFTDFYLSGKSLRIDSLLQLKPIEINYRQANFSIHFSVLSYLQTEKLTYYYRMVGINNEWKKIDQSGQLNFSMLPPGKYILQLYAENIDGLKSPEITSLYFYIKPPLWRTYWFITALLTVIAMIAYAMHRLYVKRILAVEAIRSRVARDLHDDMGSTLSTINILSAMAKAKLTTDAIRTGEYISKISDNSQRMMEAMDDIVWAIKPSNDSMHKIIARMREFATNVLEAKQIDVQFETDTDVLAINFDMEARRDLFLIFKEAINNIAKYAKCTQTQIHISCKQPYLFMHIKDNGIGFNVTAADSGNGLGNMQKRTDNLRGKLDLWSQPGVGTTIQLTIPLR